MAGAVAVVVADVGRGGLGLPGRAAAPFGGTTVLEHTLRRAAEIKGIQRIVVVHPRGQAVQGLIDGLQLRMPVVTFASEPGRDMYRAMRLAARSWAVNNWRGGLGGATCYDELLPAEPLAAALQANEAESAIILGGDWVCVDPALCAQVLELHLEAPDARQLAFCQAPPGLAGIAVGRGLLGQMAGKVGGFGTLLAYVPTRPQADPIGRDVCTQIPAPVRDTVMRFIYDTPRACALLDEVARTLGGKLPGATATEIAAAAREIAAKPEFLFARLPQQVTLELTARRQARGPIVPQHHVELKRGDMPVEQALAIVAELGQVGDVALTLGGLGDALLHPHWEQVVAGARKAGVLQVGIETDLLVPTGSMEKVLSCQGLGVLRVRVNADTAAVYERVMGPVEPVAGDQFVGAAQHEPGSAGKDLTDLSAVMGKGAFGRVLANLQWLLSERNRRTTAASGADGDPSVVSAEGIAPGSQHAGLPGVPGVPWIVPEMVKTLATLPDMETFFDRWTHWTGQAVIAPATTGCGLMPALSPLVMASPRRQACRQLGMRMTILADGTVALCNQDWLGRSPLGQVGSGSLLESWRKAQGTWMQHAAGAWEAHPLCGKCSEWHRP